jgi:ISXO2 transposase-like protein
LEERTVDGFITPSYRRLAFFAGFFFGFCFRVDGSPAGGGGVRSNALSVALKSAGNSNTLEGFFSLLKRGINGTFHHVSRGHLDRYCDEFAFRYEHRKATDGARAAFIVTSAEGKRLTFKQPA